MNFGTEIKKEIAEKLPKDDERRKAFLSGLLRGNGNLYSQNGILGLQFRVDGEEIAEYVAESFFKLFSYEFREVSVARDNRLKRDVVTMNLYGEDTVKYLVDLGILVFEKGEPVVSLKPFGTVENDAEQRAFFRGLFMSSGSCSLPSGNSASHTRYHLEMDFSHYVFALETSDRLYKAGVYSNITRRKGSYLVYIKSGEQIKNFVAYIGCPKAVLKLTEVLINREIVNDSNRRKNCDMGNINRQINASEKQINAINRLKEKGELETLKAPLREIAVARLQNSDETLNELADRLKITKSCLNHRLRKLVSLAENK